jgi:acyl phosphate:glycerol-3-phosphate acyltransferase
MNWIFFAIIGYLCGSIPFGLLLTQAAGMGDVRKVGSGNIGATNVLRMGNKKIAALTLLCDGLKGYFPVFAATIWGGEHAALAAGFGALAGHIFPVWLKFKGGKGVATGLGVIFAWSWPLGLVFCAVWLSVFLLTRMSSVGALAAMLATAVAAVLGMSHLLLPIWAFPLLAIIVWITHRANIARILKGEESKSSFSSKA